VKIIFDNAQPEAGALHIRTDGKESPGIYSLRPVVEDGNRLVLSLVCPDGSSHDQRACFPGPGYEPGTDISPFEIGGVRIALCCADDIFQPQYARSAAAIGCSLLLCGTDRVLCEELLMSGPWSACQANCLPVAVRSPGSFRLFLPCALTSDASGMGETGFDTDGLTAAYESFPVFDCLNPSFFRRYREELGR